MYVVILCLAMIPKLMTLTGLFLKKLLRAALQNNFFSFEGKISKQVDRVAMGSPVGPTLANAFLCFHEKVWLDESSDEFKLVYCRRYVDDIFWFCFVHLIILRNSKNI